MPAPATTLNNNASRSPTRGSSVQARVSGALAATMQSEKAKNFTIGFGAEEHAANWIARTHALTVISVPLPDGNRASVRGRLLVCAGHDPSVRPGQWTCRMPQAMRPVLGQRGDRRQRSTHRGRESGGPGGVDDPRQPAALSLTANDGGGTTRACRLRCRPSAPGTAGSPTRRATPASSRSSFRRRLR